ncbi:hypothetical protein sS8_2022 [Methylocaldum marinum]|uniref:Uncharacterized protein n=1 Tax=Methylocaldum marinum TaxID=1432792 RepID=A0A250KR08_9GAMM|nr:hypothetical protein sS8_2022 [Methylocaldum marinum]
MRTAGNFGLVYVAFSGFRTNDRIHPGNQKPARSIAKEAVKKPSPTIYVPGGEFPAGDQCGASAPAARCLCVA